MSKIGEPNLASVTVPGELEQGSVRGNLIGAVWLVPECNGWRVSWNVLERGCDIGLRQNGVVNPGDPEVEGGKANSFVAQHADSSRREQALHASGIVRVIMIAEDGKGSQGKGVRVSTNDMGSIGKVSRRLGHVVTTQQQEIRVLAHDELHRPVDIGGQYRRPYVCVGDKADTEFDPVWFADTQAQVLELDLAWRAMTRVPRDS